MGIVGIGNDLIAIARIQQTYLRFGDRFLKRFLNPLEIKEFERRRQAVQSKDSSPRRPYEHLASTWAVKESVYKAFGGVDRKRLNFVNMKIVHSSHGKPTVEFEGNTKELATEMGIKKVHVAITHDDVYAIANVILES